MGEDRIPKSACTCNCQRKESLRKIPKQMERLKGRSEMLMLFKDFETPSTCGGGEIKL
jgi:hypothetical protein